MTTVLTCLVFVVLGAVVILFAAILYSVATYDETEGERGWHNQNTPRDDK